MKRTNIRIVVITFCLYLVNQYLKQYINDYDQYWFMVCYLNDILAGILFVAYINVVLSYSKFSYRLVELRRILIVMFASGLIWELIIPMLKRNAVTDVCDIFAYCAGGFLYWCLISRIKQQM